jgi:hypothetical protein
MSAGVGGAVNAGEDLIAAVERKELTEAALRAKLEAHIEQADQDQGASRGGSRSGDGCQNAQLLIVCACVRSAGVHCGGRPRGGHHQVRGAAAVRFACVPRPSDVVCVMPNV